MLDLRGAMFWSISRSNTEALKWPTGLERRHAKARGFHGTLGVATLLGMGVALNFTSIDPIKALFWSAVINGIAAVSDHGRNDADDRQSESDGCAQAPIAAKGGRMDFHCGHVSGGSRSDRHLGPLIEIRSRPTPWNSFRRFCFDSGITRFRSRSLSSPGSCSCGNTSASRAPWGTSCAGLRRSFSACSWSI